MENEGIDSLLIDGLHQNRWIGGWEGCKKEEGGRRRSVDAEGGADSQMYKSIPPSTDSASIQLSLIMEGGCQANIRGTTT